MPAARGACSTTCDEPLPEIFGERESLRAPFMAIGGWKTRSVFNRYNITDQRDIAEAMLRLEAAEKAQGEQQNVIVTETGHDSVTVTP